MRPVAPPGRGWTVWSRTASCVLSAMAASVGLGVLVGSTITRYDGVLVGCLAMLSLAAAVEMWWRNGFEARLAAVVVAGLTLVGQVLVATVGRPGAGATHWHPAGLAVLVLAAAVPVLVLLDAHVVNAPRTAVEPPYAL